MVAATPVRFAHRPCASPSGLMTKIRSRLFNIFKSHGCNSFTKHDELFRKCMVYYGTKKGKLLFENRICGEYSAGFQSAARRRGDRALITKSTVGKRTHGSAIFGVERRNSAVERGASLVGGSLLWACPPDPGPTPGRASRRRDLKGSVCFGF